MVKQADKIAKQADKMMKTILWDEPWMSWDTLYDSWNAAEMGSNEYKVIGEVIRKLQVRAKESKESLTKLGNDLKSLGFGAWDLGDAWENIDPQFTQDSVDFDSEIYRHCCNVVACFAEDKGIDINTKLGYTIY